MSFIKKFKEKVVAFTLEHTVLGFKVEGQNRKELY